MKKLIDIFADLQSENLTVYIPSYQRGYRWTKDEIRQLLVDLDQSRGGYFLQVLVARNDGEGHLRIVDGQQRLTTAMLILKCCGRWPDIAEPQFESRDNNGGEVDSFFRDEAKKTINEFFLPEQNHDKNQIANKLLDCNFIYYTDIKNENEEMRLFHRINMWKMPLRDSELVKCILLADKSTATVRAEEWNEIEHWLYDDAVFYYLFGNDETLLKDRMAAFLEAIIGSDKGNKYPVFSKLDKDITGDAHEKRMTLDTEWDAVLSAYNGIRGILGDPVLYHLLGWKLHRWVYRKEDAFSLAQLRGNSMPIILRGCLPSKEEQSIPSDYGSGDDHAIRNYLLLANVAYCALGYACPYDFEQHVQQNPRSIEHIHARNQAKLSWESFEKIFNDVFKDRLHEIYDQYSSDEDRDRAEADLACACKNDKGEWKVQYPGENLDNTIGNLSLLTDSVNSKFNNGEFYEKATILREKDGITWLPPLTRDVFLKMIPAVNNKPLWSKDDRIAYADFMKSIIGQFVSIAERRVEK